MNSGQKTKETASSMLIRVMARLCGCRRFLVAIRLGYPPLEHVQEHSLGSSIINPIIDMGRDGLCALARSPAANLSLHVHEGAISGVHENARALH